MITKIERMPKNVYDYRKMITPVAPIHVLVCDSGHAIVPQVNRNTTKKVKIDLCQ